MTTKEYQSIKKKLDIALGEAEKEALGKGVDVTIYEFQVALSKLKDKLLERLGVDKDEFEQFRQQIKEFPKKELKEKLDKIVDDYTQKIQLISADLEVSLDKKLQEKLDNEKKKILTKDDIVNIVKPLIPKIPEIPEIPEVKYYDDDIKRIEEKVDTIKMPEIPPIKYYDKEVKELQDILKKLKDESDKSGALLKKEFEQFKIDLTRQQAFQAVERGETDPVFTAWDKSTGISITESQISDLQAYLLNITGESIFDLSDFPADPNADKYLMWDDSESTLVWAAGGGGAAQLSDLTDVGVTTPTDKNVLVADGDSWESRALVEADISDLGSYLENVVEDTTPQLGGDLDLNGKNIDFPSTPNISDVKDEDDMATNSNTMLATQQSIKAYADLKLPLAGGTMAGNINFATYKAIAMTCDNGATVPASPVAGQWFLHTPTGRNVLMIYDGSNWIPIISLGTMTMYVDKTDGTDSYDYGGAVDAGAFKSVQYAVNTVPGLVGGSVYIYINNEDYDETVTIRGKSFIGNYAIYLYGTLNAQETVTSATVATGTGATQGTITKAGAFAGNTYANMLCYLVTDAAYRIIDSHTDNVLTLIGTAPSATAQNVIIYNWGTKINKVSIPGQQGVYVYDVYFDSSNCIGLDAYAKAFMYRCKALPTEASARSVTLSQSYLYLYACYIEESSGASDRVINEEFGSLLYTFYSKIKITSTNTYGFLVVYVSSLYFLGGSKVDSSVAKTGTYGIYTTGGSQVTCWSADAWGYPRLENLLYGIYAITGSVVTNTSNNVYTGTTNAETDLGADWSYID